MQRRQFASTYVRGHKSDNPEERRPAAIKIEGGRNIRITDNVSVGMPLLEAKDVDDLTSPGNKTFLHSAPTLPSKKAWYEHAAGKSMISLIIAIVAGGILYALGWN